jgi:hypothetical protein
MVLPPDNGPMLFLEKPSHHYFLSIAAHNLVGQLHPFGKLRQGEYGFNQADWEFSLCTTQVQQNIPVIICIILDVGNRWQWAQICNPFDIFFLRFCRWQESFIARLMGYLSGTLEGGPGGGVKQEEIGILTGLFPGGHGGIFSAPGNHGPCPGNCCWGII